MMERKRKRGVSLLGFYFDRQSDAMHLSLPHPTLPPYREHVRVDVGVDLLVQGLLHLLHGLGVAGGGGGKDLLRGREGGRGEEDEGED
jgi:hypothetical protein